MKYYLAETIRNGDDFGQIFEAPNDATATRIAENVWNTMTSHDRSRRAEFWVGRLPDGFVLDYDEYPGNYATLLHDFLSE